MLLSFSGRIVKAENDEPDLRYDLDHGTAGTYDGLDRFGRVDDKKRGQVQLLTGDICMEFPGTLNITIGLGDEKRVARILEQSVWRPPQEVAAE